MRRTTRLISSSFCSCASVLRTIMLPSIFALPAVGSSSIASGSYRCTPNVASAGTLHEIVSGAAMSYAARCGTVSTSVCASSRSRSVLDSPGFTTSSHAAASDCAELRELSSAFVTSPSSPTVGAHVSPSSVRRSVCGSAERRAASVGVAANEPDSVAEPASTVTTNEPSESGAPDATAEPGKVSRTVSGVRGA